MAERSGKWVSERNERAEQLKAYMVEHVREVQGLTIEDLTPTERHDKCSPCAEIILNALDEQDIAGAEAERAFCLRKIRAAIELAPKETGVWLKRTITAIAAVYIEQEIQ